MRTIRQIVYISSDRHSDHAQAYDVVEWMKREHPESYKEFRKEFQFVNWDGQGWFDASVSDPMDETDFVIDWLIYNDVAEWINGEPLGWESV